MNEPIDHSQYVYVGGSLVDVKVCLMAYRNWGDQCGCFGSVKDPHRPRCFFVTSNGICERDKTGET